MSDHVFTDTQKLKLRAIDEEIDHLTRRKQNARTPETRKFFDLALRDLNKKAAKETEEYYRLKGSAIR